MQEKIDSSGANGAWVHDNTKTTFKDKRITPKELRKQQITYLVDEVQTLRDRINWLEDELEEAYDLVYRLEHGLSVSWDGGRAT